jgi:hypothetical protein
VLAVIPIIEQHHARFSAFEPTTLQHDESVSTNLPFISMRCLFCACTCLLRKETECSKGVREPHHHGQSLPFRAPDETRLPSKGPQKCCPFGGLTKQLPPVRLLFKWSAPSASLHRALHTKVLYTAPLRSAAPSMDLRHNFLLSDCSVAACRPHFCHVNPTKMRGIWASWAMLLGRHWSHHAMYDQKIFGVASSHFPTEALTGS